MINTCRKIRAISEKMLCCIGIYLLCGIYAVVLGREVSPPGPSCPKALPGVFYDEPLNPAIWDRLSTNREPRFHVLVLYENGGHHLPFSKAAIPWLNQLASDSNFVIKYIQDPDSITETFLSRFQLIIQLDYPPYSWPPAAMQAFKKFIETGRIGWLGLHHASLLGEFDGYPMWDWFSWLMGGIRFKNYIASLAAADVVVCDSLHPVMGGIADHFLIKKEEWYTWDKVPDTSYIQVLATVDENSYQPNADIKMHGFHPVVWTNTRVKARNLYIFMGHDPGLWTNTVYKHLFRNALFWTAGIR
ncbi:MAG TPA: ThuA domain-containing protein [Arachidicoccus sp.]|nr:ThuA domain-containing protein [Arachidicoccus sp.]